MRTRSHASELLDVAPFREAFQASGLAATTVAERMGHIRADTGRGDSSWLLRRLGIYRETRGYTNVRIGYDVALDLVHALDLDPVDLGL